MHLLIIDDGSGTGEVLSSRLSGAGFRPSVMRPSEIGQPDSVHHGVSAIVVDCGPVQNRAAETIRPLRAAGANQPLMVLSTRDDWREKVECLDAGADDYLVKPVRSEEVAARLRALIRRGTAVASDHVIFGDIDLGLSEQCAWKSGECLNLTRSEYRLLRLFLFTPERTVSKEQILQTLWGKDAVISANAVEVQIARLRRKLGLDRITTVRGIGYRMNEGKQEGATISTAEPCQAPGS